MLRTWLVLGMGSLFAGGAWSQQPVQRPMHEMKGDCANFAWPMAKEFAAWALSGDRVAAAKSSAAAIPSIPVGVRRDIELLPHAEVQFAAPPQQDRGGPDKFSGLVRIQVERPGLYRVSAGNGLWLDLVEGGKVVPSAAFEMQTGCDRIFKSVAYRLDKPGLLLLQLSGSPTKLVPILVTATD